MLKNKKKLLHLVQQLDSELIARAKNNNTINLAELLEVVMREYIDVKKQLRQQNLPSTRQNLHQYDALTQLPNRNLLREYVEQAIHRATRHNNSFALLFIDIDHFKTINDTHGHQVGDKVLQQLAQRVLGSIRQSDVLCRLSGDEFCLLVEELESAEAIIRIVEAIREKLTPSYTVNDLSLIITTSMGVSVFPDDGNSFDDLLHFADLAMYEAKRNGRNAVSLFKPEIAAKIHQINGQQKELKSALKLNQLELFMQPELNLSTGDICAVRQYCVLSKANLQTEQAIYQTAQDSRQVALLNKHLVHIACQQAQKWQRQYHVVPRIVIPLYKEFASSYRCAPLINEAINGYGLNGATLEFEVNDLDLIQHSEAGFDNLQKLHLMGCQLSLINFGIGPSSLKFLSSGIINKIKIDRALIDPLENDLPSQQMLEAIIQVSEKFSIRTVALDVTRMSQLSHLEKLNCTGIRGDYLSPVVTMKEFDTILENYNRQHQLATDDLVEKKYSERGIPPQ